MPIYAYRCEACGHAKDALQKVSDPPLHTCPACGAEAFVKQVTAAGFQLKGSGWYVTDFRGGDAGKKKAELGDAEPAAADKSDKVDKSEAAAKPSADDTRKAPVDKPVAPAPAADKSAPAPSPAAAPASSAAPAAPAAAPPPAKR